MNLRPSFLALACLLAASVPAHANADLAQKKNCMSCHKIDQKVIGPAFKDVAVKYAGQKDAADKLVQKVLKGGVGAWGQIPMPSNPNVSESDARLLVAWVLSQNK
jgi:cytochrome c